ncbi:uncharacterized protein DNG_02230 [Cephalotrichum gorgonifer]|uniref:Uncharacterized protein n=1 Tax=Cephalotrichum gorgonifer TaxID=2041049 RepID=A0AAE8MUS4_9PEZI|nr:uncharacterized protein DNG_02230 [Cephalotrichum gorgonifer]
MSFGFGVGDFITVYKQVNSIRKQFVDAPHQFKALSAEVRSLSIVLQDAEIKRDALSDRQARRLAMVVDECARPGELQQRYQSSAIQEAA